MLELIGIDGLTQWDVGRQIKVDKDIDMVHFSNRPYGYSKNVKVTNGVADVPDMFLTSCAPLRVWTYVGDFEKGYTKIEKIYEVKPKNRPEDYIYTPEEVKTWEKLQSEIGDLAGLATEKKDNLVAAINEVAADISEGIALDTTLTQSGKAADAKAVGDALAGKQPSGSYLTNDELAGAIDEALAQAKASGEFDGADGATGATGADGKSAYQYAQDGGYTGTEAEFAEKLAQEQLAGTTDELTPTQVYDAVSAGIPVKVQYIDSTYGLSSFTAFNVSESMNVIASNSIINYNDACLLAVLYGNKSNNGWFYEVTPLAKPSDIPAALPNPNALTFTGAVTGSYDGSTAVSVEIPSGGGADISLGLTSASVGQIIKVKAIDESGKPTAWEAADMPSGSNDVWEQIADITLEEEVGNVEINKDTNGNAFLLKKFYILVNSEVPTSKPFTYIKAVVNGNKTISNNSSNNNTDKKRYFYCYAEFIPDVGALCWQGVSTVLYNNATNMQQILRGYNELYKEAGFYNLKIVPNDGGTLIGGVGTTVKVWGVRA